MATWNELFKRGEMVARFAERPVHEFVSLVERSFSDRPLRIWDLCCGAGRHTVAVAARGHSVFASDAASEGVALTRARLAESGLTGESAVADMAVCPWPDVRFHGVVSWDALHHNAIAGIHAALATVRRQLVDGGWLLLTLKSVRADSYGSGQQIEAGTFVQESGPEAGVPHHYFDEAEIRDALAEWELRVLLERRCEYRERSADFLDVNPFDYTAWAVLARKPGGGGTTAR